MDYSLIFNCMDIILASIAVLFFIFYWFRVVYVILAFTPTKKIPKTDKLYHYNILIPARNESKVISNILASIKNQSYDQSYLSVYVIVESEDDPTIQIAKSYGYNSIVRKDLEGKRTKGYALREAIDYLNANNITCDAYMIFDADNVLEKNFITRINRLKAQGYQLGLGYRNSTNASDNWISGCSTILFGILNSFGSLPKSKLIHKVTLSGTGYYLDKEVVDQAGGFIWNGLTEDVELTNYCYANEIKCGYVPEARYYDEQPTTMKVARKQHIRWIWGFSGAGKKYYAQIRHNLFHSKKEKIAKIEVLVGMWPLIVLIVSLILYLLLACGFWISSVWVNPELTELCFIKTVQMFGILYLSLAAFSMLTILADRKTLKWDFGFSVMCAFLFPIYFLDFIPAFFIGLNKKNRTWTVIKHEGVITNDRAKKESKK